MQKESTIGLFLLLFSALNVSHAGGGPWELYSWRPTGGDWHFNLLPGTDRDKTIQEIANPQTAIVGAKNLKNRLKKLPPGEEVVWVNYAKEPIPETITADVLKFSESEGLNLKMMW